MEKEYICICGKEFKSQKALSGHHTQCKIFYLDRDGNLDNYYKRRINLSKSQKGRKIETKKCPYCEKKISKNHFNRHIQKHEKGNFDRNTSKTGYYLDHDDLFCKFCGKECKNKNSIRQHEIRCKKNPNKINTTLNGFNNKGRIPWNNGLSKETDERIKKSVDTFNKNENAGLHINKCKQYSPEIRQRFKDNPKVGCIRKGSGRGKKGWYKGYFCDSTWELAYVIYNINHNIPFKRCKRIYEYEYNGETHKYYPDFELEDGTIIEIKGYSNKQTEAKINSVQDRPIKVLYGNDLEYVFTYVKENYQYKNLWDLYE